MGFVDVGYSLSEVVLSTASVVDSFELEDCLAGILVDLRSALKLVYLLKLRNLALTQSLTCLPTFALAIFLAFGATGAGLDIWL